METFKVGIICPFLAEPFTEGEQGMKCADCPRVIKVAAWREKRRCFCGSTNAVLAIASSSTSHVSLRTNRERRNGPPRPRNVPPQTTEPLSETSQPRVYQAILYMIVVFATSFLAPTAYYKVFDSGSYWNGLIDRIWQGHNLQLKKDWEDIWKNPFSL